MKRFLPLLRSLAALLGAALLFACQKPDIGGPDDSGGGKPGKTIPVESVKLESITVGSSFHASNDPSVLDRTWHGPLKSISVSGCPNLKRVEICSAYLNGTLPSFIQALEGKGYASYPYKYSYYVSQTPGKRLDYTTHSNGYTMPGEPGSPYRHPLGGYYDLDE